MPRTPPMDAFPIDMASRSRGVFARALLLSCALI